MDSIEDKGGDFTISLSSEVIAEVMGRHFNRDMFKKQVEIVDLKPLADGYQFLLAYVQKGHTAKQALTEAEALQRIMSMPQVTGPVRNANGRYAKKDT